MRNFSQIRKTVFVIVFLSGAFNLFAQEIQTKDPVPYEENEFPEWMLELRRGEIIAVGAFPFMLFFTGFGYDTFRFVTNGFGEQYRPWPFKSTSSAPLTDGERITILSVSAGLSVTVAIIDFILGRMDEKNIERRKAIEERRRDLERAEPQAPLANRPIDGGAGNGTQ